MNKYILTQYFLRTGKMEGISYLLLLMIAMPLKYIWEMPEYVQIIGMVHGVLFVIFVFFITRMVYEKNMTRKKGFWAFFLSLLPFGTFFLRKLL